jgi:hypothetical protein
VKQGDTGKCVEVLHRHVLAHVDRIQTYMRPGVNSITFSTHRRQGKGNL